MRALDLILLLSIVTFAFADDKDYCKKSCGKKYSDNEAELSVCESGCGLRGSISDGYFAFISCHNRCAEMFENKTTEETEPCHFACSLPMTNTVFMSVNMNGNDEPKVRIIHGDSPDESGSIEDIEKMIPAGSGDIFTALGLRDSPRLGNLPSLTDADDSSNPWDEMQRMHDRMQKFFSEVRRQFVERVQKEMSQDSDESESKEAKGGLVHSQRPSGHELLALKGPFVGNTNSEGRPIVVVRPLNVEGEIPAFRENSLLTEWREEGRRHPLFYQVSFLFLAVLAVLLSLVLLMRVARLRRDRYLQLRNATVITASPTSSSAPPLMKKVPISHDDFGEPSGVPPPAYDQLSIHEKQDHSKLPEIHQKKDSA